MDPRILELKRPRLSEPEATVYHIAQLRQILAARNPKLPQEELAVRILIGAGLRESELCGLAIAGLTGCRTWDVELHRKTVRQASSCRLPPRCRRMAISNVWPVARTVGAWAAR